MNVADKDLCQELYELSGWFGDLEWFEALKFSTKPSVWEPVQTDPESKNAIPAYDSGYLLRKLRPVLSELRPDTVSNYWVADNEMIEAEIRETEPENALTKLAIELIKQGILKKDNQND